MNFKRERKAKADEDKYYYNSQKIHNYYSYETLPY